jgi:hypothetical protein
LLKLADFFKKIIPKFLKKLQISKNGKIFSKMTENKENSPKTKKTQKSPNFPQ